MIAPDILSLINNLIAQSETTYPVELIRRQPQLEKYCQNIFNLKFINDILEKYPNWNELLLFNHTHVQIEQNLELISYELPNLTQEEFQLAFEVLAIKNNIFWNDQGPFVSFTLNWKENEIRCTLIHHTLTTTQRPRAFIRKISSRALTLDRFTKNKPLNLYFEKIMNDKKNILICGETGSGKTSFIRSLLELIKEKEHIVTIEDTKELLSQNSHQTSLITNDKKETQSMNQLLTFSLRLRPSRIIIGEIRSHEALTYLMAMNTGHKGILSTIHANSAVDGVSRLALLICLYSNLKNVTFEVIHQLICRNIDMIIYLEKRKIKEVIEIRGSDGKNVFYETLWPKEKLL